MTSRPATPPQIERLRTLGRARWGLALTSPQAPARLAAALENHPGGPADLLERLEAGPDEALEATTFEALSCGLTRFLRQPAQLARLVAHLTAGPPRPLRLWSAGCSRGCEPYGLAMVLLDALPDPGAWRLDVLATDLSTKALAAARRGVFGAHLVEDLPPALVARHLRPAGPDRHRVRRHLRDVVRFERANLLAPRPAGERFDAILCRNVLAHLDEPRRADLIDRLGRALAPGGLLFVGDREVVPTPYHHLHPVTPSVYRAA